jgi:hypothetical protein
MTTSHTSACHAHAAAITTGTCTCAATSLLDLVLTLRLHLTNPQVTLKGKKCFGKTPITYIAVSYGYGSGMPPVCADNK